MLPTGLGRGATFTRFCCVSSAWHVFVFSVSTTQDAGTEGRHVHFLPSLCLSRCALSVAQGPCAALLEWTISISKTEPSRRDAHKAGFTLCTVSFTICLWSHTRGAALWVKRERLRNTAVTLTHDSDLYSR